MFKPDRAGWLDRFNWEVVTCPVRFPQLFHQSTSSAGIHKKRKKNPVQFRKRWTHGKPAVQQCPKINEITSAMHLLFRRNEPWLRLKRKGVAQITCLTSLLVVRRKNQRHHSPFDLQQLPGMWMSSVVLLDSPVVRTCLCLESILSIWSSSAYRGFRNFWVLFSIIFFVNYTCCRRSRFDMTLGSSFFAARLVLKTMALLPLTMFWYVISSVFLLGVWNAKSIWFVMFPSLVFRTTNFVAIDDHESSTLAEFTCRC